MRFPADFSRCSQAECIPTDSAVRKEHWYLKRAGPDPPCSGTPGHERPPGGFSGTAMLPQPLRTWKPVSGSHLPRIFHSRQSSLLYLSGTRSEDALPTAFHVPFKPVPDVLPAERAGIMPRGFRAAGHPEGCMRHPDSFPGAAVFVFPKPWVVITFPPPAEAVMPLFSGKAMAAPLSFRETSCRKKPAAAGRRMPGWNSMHRMAAEKPHTMPGMAQGAAG